MKTIKTSVISILLLMVSLYSCAQQGKEIIIATNKTTNSSGEDNLIVLLKEGNLNIKILDLKRNVEDFKYLGNYNLKNNKFLALFSEYSSPVGLTKYYYFDTDNLLLYQSEFFNETEFPQLFSLDIEKQCIYYVSINNQDCGKILNKKISIEKCASVVLNESNLKIFNTIVIN
jgi:hypothetical protein